MDKGTIKLCYRKIIDVNATSAWESYLFDDTYTEFLLQVQNYNANNKYASFAELLQSVPEAENLHFLVSAAAFGYVKQLNNKVPDVTNSLGRLFLPFENFRFEIINSHISDKSKHRVAINFYTDQLRWHDTINNQLLVSVPGKIEDGEVLTDMFTMQPFLSIYSYKPA